FAATHNSYAGGRRASIRAQLDGGVRALELDVHDEDFSNAGFRVGHSFPGDDVFHEDGNPAGDELDAWLGTISTWSLDHRAHAPITLMLDLKDAIGELGELDELLVRAFGERVYAAPSLGDGIWPTVAELRGRILVVLSGDEATRAAYRARPTPLAFVE